MMLLTRKMSVLLLLFAACMGIVNADDAASSLIDIVASGKNGMTLIYRPGDAAIDTVKIGDRIYQRLSFDTHTSVEESGSPDVPSASVYFAAPDGSSPTVSIDTVNGHTLSGILLPPVPHFVKEQDGFSGEVYDENPEKYAMSGFFPNTHVRLGEKAVTGSLAVWELILNPVLFDAHNRKASIADSLTIHVTFPGGVDASYLPPHIPDYILNADVFNSLAARKPAQSLSGPFDTGEWYKLAIEKSGMYIVYGTDLSKAGFPIGSVSVDDIRLFYNGGMMIDVDEYRFDSGDLKEVAVKINDVTHDGIFNSNDSIVFYGESLSRFYTQKSRTRLYYQNHLFSETNVYWLTVSSEGTPVRFGSAGLPIDDALPSTTQYTCSRHIENDYQLELTEGGKEWFWDAVYDKIKTYTIATPGALSGYESTFRIGMLNQVARLPHQVYVYVNDEKYILYPFSSSSGFVTHTCTAELKQGNNEFHIGRKYEPGESNVSVHLDWIEVDYTRALSFDENNMEMFLTGDSTPVKYVVSNVNRSSVAVFETTDPFAVNEVTSLRYDSGAKSLTFQITPDDYPKRFVVSDMNSAMRVPAITRKIRSNAHAIAANTNYIVIAPTEFMEEARKLAEWRSHDSSIDPLVSMAVDFNDIIDDYNGGIYDPLAIRNFLKTVWDSGGTGRNYYCCILGDAIYKYKDLTTDQIGKNKVPSYSDVESNTYLTNDDYYCWFDYHRSPAFSMGRLCATDKETAAGLVNKVIGYEKNGNTGRWRNRVLLVADDEIKPSNKQEIEFTVQTETLDDPVYIPNNFERTKLFLVDYPRINDLKPDVTEAMISAFNDGVLLSNYIGHGNDDLLAHEHILVGTRDIERMTNDKKLPLFLAFSCSVGKFTLLDNISLAELLGNKKDGGALAVIAATNETYSSPNFDLNKQFFVNLFDRQNNKETRIGLSLSRTKSSLSGSNQNNYLLFGDPASRLMVPRFDFSTAEVDTVYRLQRLNINGSVQNSSSPTSYDGTLYITARGPKIRKTYTTYNNVNTVKYTQPGRLFHYGEQPITGDGFAVEFVVPKDLPASEKDACIFLFATGQENEASGAITDFAIGGLDKNAPDDRSGPDIQLSFDGKNFDDGDYISRQPMMKVSISDQSGVNIYGNRGHNITLLVDNSEIIVLTDKYKALHSYATGTIEYQLPILSPGEHTFEINAYDTYNNASKIAVTANVVGSESGNISIMNLLNYPNPMGNNGTTFTFSLTDDAQTADIKVYSQSGRLVDSVKFPAGYGFNQVNWKPPFSIANGVYFYKLTVRSVNGRKASKIEKLVVMK